MTFIWLIAGTKDARDIARCLLNRKHRVLATVTTAYGRELLATLPGLEVEEGQLSQAAMQQLILQRNIDCVVDASHPFAQEVSQNAMAACRNTDTTYLRFERQETDLQEIPGEVKVVSSFEEAATQARSVEGNVFLAIGSNHLAAFTEQMRDPQRIFARVLPDSRMVARCEAAGLSTGNILAVKGPFSQALNLEMMRHCQAKVLVTKESGETGGTGEKLQAARELGIPVILVKRPALEYTEKVGSLEGLIQFLQQVETLNHRER